MPRRCSTCGEPGANVAAFCGRCGALGTAQERTAPRRAASAAPARRGRQLARRIGPRQVVTAVAALTVVGLLTAGLEVDDATGEVTVPPRSATGESVRAAAGDGPPASPAPPPQLDDCEDARGDGQEPCVRWRRPRAPDQVVAADAGSVYLAEDGGALVALSRDSGAVRWHAMTGVGDLVEATVGPHGIVVAGAGGAATGDVLAGIDPAVGTVRWTAPAAGSVELHSDGTGVLLLEPSGIRQLDAVTGAQRWVWPTTDPAGVELVPGTGSVPIVSSARTLSAIDVATGTARWQVSLPQLRGAASGGDGRLVALDGGGALVGVDEASGTVDWESRLAFGDRSAVRILGTDGLVVVEVAPPPAADGTRTLRVVGVDPTSGAVRWVHLYGTTVERRRVVLTPTTALLVGTSTAGTVASLDLASGRIAWQRELGSEPAHVRVDGEVVVAASGRNLLLLAAEDGSVVAAARTASPVIGVVVADDGSAVLTTTTEIVAVVVPTGG